ncbi:hypothetical protein AYL99_06868 [Fonsecaea erecta]|uniref:Sialidase domain-containing protein n=1 Tax=Fonsecaea erecta TaxID=1367422 RepID=A0A178ZIF6_9EURO|nr:hypothetical protein AYL99_06868 [Fonsecaea erecta]OAP59570.1 hypothetical protein AYL99_06868 [Fonsecaea erecta]
MRSSIFLSLAPLAAAAPWNSWSPPASSSPDFANVTIFVAPEDWPQRSTSYARVVLLNQDCETDNVLLSTFTLTPPEGRYYPVFASHDLGETWTQISQIEFGPETGKDFSAGRLAQPDFLELPIDIGDYPAGTVLFTGMGQPTDGTSTNIYVYASRDKGYTWEYVSQVAQGGPANTTNGATPIWEPFLIMSPVSHNPPWIMDAYSDQRDPAHGQKLAHQSSPDLLTWGPVINDAAEANYTMRPGMTTMAKMGNGQYIFTYELGFSIDGLPTNSPYAVHYRISSDPEDFGSAEEHLLKSSDGKIPSSSPYVVWTPIGPTGKGTLVVSDGSYAQIFMNTEYGDPNAWFTVDAGHGVGYSRSLTVLPDQSKVLLVNGGMYNTSVTVVSAGIIDVPGTFAPGFGPVGSGKDSVSSCNGVGFWNNWA